MGGGDPFVREKMREVAKVAEDAVAILSTVAPGGPNDAQTAALGALMNRNLI